MGCGRLAGAGFLDGGSGVPLRLWVGEGMGIG